LIDSSDAAHNNKPLNRGMNALFKSRTAPFSPDISTPYGSDVYKGIFLNENLTFNPQKPTYSVRAPQTQPFTINGQSYNCTFQNWSVTQGQASFKDSNALETAVVFKQAGTTIAAIYQSPLISGPISHSTTWNSAKILTDNVSVLTNVALIIASDVTLGTFNITSTGGNIVKQSGTINGLKATLYDNTYYSQGYYKGFYGQNIQSAITDAPSISGQPQYVLIEPNNYSESISVSNKYNLNISGSNQGTINIYGYCSFYNCQDLMCTSFNTRGMYLNGCEGVNVVGVNINLP
jgi:hypothetical protein